MASESARPQEPGRGTEWPIASAASSSARAKTRCRSTSRRIAPACRRRRQRAGRHLCRAETRSVPQARRGRRRADHGRLHAGSAVFSRSRGRSRRSRRDHLRQHPRDRRLVAATPRTPARRWRRCWRPRPSRCRDMPLVSLDSEGVVLIYGRDESAIEAADLLEGSSRRHRADHAAGRDRRRRARPTFRS